MTTYKLHTEQNVAVVEFDEVASLDTRKAQRTGRNIEHFTLGHQLADELFHCMFWKRAHERIYWLAVLQRHHHGYRLHLKRLSDARVAINIDLRKYHLAVRRLDDFLDDGAEGLARPTPCGPQVDNDGGRL